MEEITNKAEYYFKLVPGIERLAVDYAKLDESPFPICVVICERKFRIKTYGAKKYCYEQWVKNGRGKPNTIGLRNLVDDIEIESGRFLDDVPEEMVDCRVVNKKSGVSIVEGNDAWLNMGAINSPRTMRGSRTYLKYIVWDEFNDSLRHVRGDMIENFINLLSSSSKMIGKYQKNERKAFILGNNRTINHPLFFELGVTSLTQDVTKIYTPNGDPLMLIICPILSEEEIAKVIDENKNDGEFQLAKMTGRANHIYFNASQYDKINSVYEYGGFSPSRHLEAVLNRNIRSIIPDLEKQLTLRIGKDYLTIFNVPKHLRRPEFNNLNRYHVVDTGLIISAAKAYDDGLDKYIDEKMLHIYDLNNNPVVYVSDVKGQEEGELVIDPRVVANIRQYVSKNWISFENVISRDLFFQWLNKK